MARADFLLPARARFGGQRPSRALALALGRADICTTQPGARAQLRRQFALVPEYWPLAALTRRVDAGDAEAACWLRADPAHVRASINGATLVATGDMLALDPGEAAALLVPLRPLFGDAGIPIDAPVPAHWYLRLPREARLPVFSEPGDALGEDVFEHLPDGEGGRRWRALLNEAQVLLHHHPVNAQRAAEGRLPVNSLWFWGAGVLPDQVTPRHAQVRSDDEVVRALAAGVAAASLPARYATPHDDLLADLREARDLAAIERDWLQPALGDVASGALAALGLDFGDGRAFELRRGQRWRVWRRPLVRLDD